MTAKSILKTWNGEDLFYYYTSFNNEYSQTLMTAFTCIGDSLFSMLKKAEAENLKIIIESENNENLDDPPIKVSIG